MESTEFCVTVVDEAAQVCVFLYLRAIVNHSFDGIKHLKNARPPYRTMLHNPIIIMSYNSHLTLS